MEILQPYSDKERNSEMGANPGRRFDVQQFQVMYNQITHGLILLEKHTKILAKSLSLIQNVDIRNEVLLNQNTAAKIIAETATQISKLNVLTLENHKVISADDQVRLANLTLNFRTATQYHFNLHKQLVTVIKSNFPPPSMPALITTTENDRGRLVLHDELQGATSELDLHRAIDVDPNTLERRPSPRSTNGMVIENESIPAGEAPPDYQRGETFIYRLFCRSNVICCRDSKTMHDTI